jgi:hypothetical protein
MSTQKKSFVPLPPESNGRNKSMGARLNTTQSSKLHTKDALLAFRKSTLRLDEEDQHPVGLHLRRKRTLEPLPSNLKQTNRPPRRHPLTNDGEGKEDHPQI